MLRSVVVGKHETGYERVEKDLYPTPSWATQALLEHIDVAGLRVWECAAGNGQMAEVLKAAGASVYTSDIEARDYNLDAVLDFVAGQMPTAEHFDGLITNPPFGFRGKLAEQFIRVGLRRIAFCPFMALLLPVDFDSAVTRRQLFGGCPHYAGKIVLTKRVTWFSNPDPHRERPKENSAWFLWDRNVIRGRPPVVLYAPLTNHTPRDRDHREPAIVDRISGSNQ
jgi:hypothetical protein